jgi:plastocyanin
MEKIKEWVRNNKNIAVLILAVILVTALAFASNYVKQSNSEAKPAAEEVVNGCVEGLCPGTEEPAATPSDNPSYSEALQVYAGRTIVLGANCDASPSAFTTKVGTKILVTNTSKTIVNVTVPGKSIILRPYRYFTQTFKAPGTYPITCNGASAATVTVQ